MHCTVSMFKYGTSITVFYYSYRHFEMTLKNKAPLVSGLLRQQFTLALAAEDHPQWVSRHRMAVPGKAAGKAQKNGQGLCTRAVNVHHGTSRASCQAQRGHSTAQQTLHIQYLLQNDPGKMKCGLHSQHVSDLLLTPVFSVHDFPRNTEALSTLCNT